MERLRMRDPKEIRLGKKRGSASPDPERPLSLVRDGEAGTVRSPSALAAFLMSLELPQYIASFEGNAIEMEHFSGLTDDDLISLGVRKLGHRKTLLKAAAEQKAPGKAPTSEARSPRVQQPQPPEAQQPKLDAPAAKTQKEANVPLVPVSPEEPSHPVCKKCGHQGPLAYREQVNATGWVVVAILLVTTCGEAPHT